MYRTKNRTSNHMLSNDSLCLSIIGGTCKFCPPSLAFHSYVLTQCSVLPPQQVALLLSWSELIFRLYTTELEYVNIPVDS